VYFAFSPVADPLGRRLRRVGDGASLNSDQLDPALLPVASRTAADELEKWPSILACEVVRARTNVSSIASLLDSRTSGR
jgi:hypothetical protein